VTVEKREIWTTDLKFMYSNSHGFVGANHNPSTAINQLEMGAKPKRIDVRIGLAEQIGIRM
jgi:hypothetical protein